MHQSACHSQLVLNVSHVEIFIRQTKWKNVKICVRHQSLVGGGGVVTLHSFVSSIPRRNLTNTTIPSQSHGVHSTRNESESKNNKRFRDVTRPDDYAFNTFFAFAYMNPNLDSLLSFHMPLGLYVCAMHEYVASRNGAWCNAESHFFLLSSRFHILHNREIGLERVKRVQFIPCVMLCNSKHTRTRGTSLSHIPCLTAADVSKIWTLLGQGNVKGNVDRYRRLPSGWS